MESGSSSNPPERPTTQKGEKLGSVLPRVEPFIPRKGHDPKELRSWAKRTGFVSNLSGESGIGVSHRDKNDNTEFDLENGSDKNGSTSPKIEIDPVLGRTRTRGVEIEPFWKRNNGALGMKEGTGRGESQRKRNGAEPSLGAREEVSKVDFNGNGNGDRVVKDDEHQVRATTTVAEPKRDDGNMESEERIDVYPDGGESGHGGGIGSSRMKFGLRENPGFGQYEFLPSFVLVD